MSDGESAKIQNSLPTERDFDPFGGGLDEQSAWRNFGGLTLDEAYKRFCDHPDPSQEDFMFMGGKAFAFYYPVVEKYLQETPGDVEYDDRYAWIIARGIINQFTGKSLPDVIHLAPRVLGLADFVQANIHLFDSQPEEQLRIHTAWQELKSHIKNVTNQGK